MSNLLKGKIAVITGGGSAGIGGAVAFAMAMEGAQVVANDIGRDPEGNRAADKMVEKIKKAGGTAVANYDSVDSMQGGAKIVKTATDNFGRIDILVNVAGNYWGVSTPDITEKDWDTVMNVHMKGTFATIKAALPTMIKQKSGRIINFSSRAAFNGPASAKVSYSNVAYNAAKAGILGLTMALALEFRESGITFNVILPSAITPLFPKEKLPLEDNLPVPQNTSPEYVAPIVVYLATDKAKDITGQYIYAAGEDICIFGRPFRLPGPHAFLHKNDKWTVDELEQLVPQVIGLP
jgi:NAD(P)-dependent dehydrogenase (short-subunit alcohol dehydrogenase family)